MIIGAAYPEVPSVHLEIKIPSLALLGELLVLIAVLGNAPYSEANVSTVGNSFVS